MNTLRIPHCLAAIALTFCTLLVLSCQPNVSETEDSAPAERQALTMSDCETCSRPTFIPLVSDSHFPVPDSTLERWVRERNGHAIRGHGWHLFEKLMYIPDTVSIHTWRTWPTATQAFASDSKPGNLGAINASDAGTHAQELNFLKSAKVPGDDIADVTQITYVAPPAVCDSLNQPDDNCSVNVDGCHFQSNGDVMIAGVVYNNAAYNHIRDQKLYDWNTLASIWQNSAGKNGGYGTIPYFPSRSVSLKPMLWPVKQSAPSTLPVFRLDCYDGTENCDRVDGKLIYAGYENQDIWDKAVAVSATDNAGTVDSLTYLYYAHKGDASGPQVGPNTYYDLPIHNVNEFYHWQLTQEEWDAMDCTDRAIVNSSFYYVYNRGWEPGDYLVLIAMHVITKEMPGWTLQSFWWDNTPQAQDSKYAMQRDSVSNPQSAAFNNYLQTSTYGMTDKNQPGQWPVAFNPYIELAAAHPIETNCRNCHLRAGFPEDSAQLNSLVQNANKKRNLAGYIQTRDGITPTTLDTLNFNSVIFDSLAMADFLWSIPDRVKPKDQ